MKSLAFLSLCLSLTALAGCSGGSAPTSTPAPTEQTFGSLTTRIVGAAQSSVTSSAAFGANVTGIAGALVDRLTLNAVGPGTLSDTKLAFVSDRDGNNEIYIMNVDGTGQTRLTNNGAGDSEPSWSPDGTKIAFQTSRDGNFEIYVMNADGSSPTRLSNNGASDFSPDWSPDGTKIAFVSDRTGFGDIYVMNADGSAQTRLTTAADSDSSPTWSPDGTKIAFSSSRDGNSEIYSMDPNGGNQTRLTNNVALDDEPSWSPDSSKIAFASNRDGDFEIYVMNADGTGQTNLSSNASNDNNPSWSPDGSRIVFSSSRDGNSEIYSMNSFGGSVTNLTRLSSDNEYLSSWSGYLPRTPKTLVGAGGTLGTAAAGFLFGQKGKAITSVVAFDTSTAGSRAASRITSQSAPFNDQGTNLIFSITTSAGPCERELRPDQRSRRPRNRRLPDDSLQLDERAGLLRLRGWQRDVGRALRREPQRQLQADARREQRHVLRQLHGNL